MENQDLNYPEKDILREYSINPIYIDEIYNLQVELLKLQKYSFENGLRIVILFEGRDTAGKGSAIFRFSQFLNPRHYRVVALGKPNEDEKGQWYFQRYIKELPKPGEIVFFDRSWYNRAVVEPVMGFCTPEQYRQFMKQVSEIERILVEDGIILIKFWFSIDIQMQRLRIEDRLSNPLKHWKVSPVDLVAQEKWDDFTRYKQTMFENTHFDYSPWIVVKGDKREVARINALKYVLSLVDYEDKRTEILFMDTDVLFPFKK